MLWCAAACGLGPVARHTTAPPGAGDVTTVPATASPASPVARYPNLDRFADPLDRVVYRSAFDVCTLAGPEGMAKGYGGQADDPTSVARAYAEFADPTRPVPAVQGCLDGLAAAAP
jgi:hypothetical protein